MAFEKRAGRGAIPESNSLENTKRVHILLNALIDDIDAQIGALVSDALDRIMASPEVEKNAHEVFPYVYSAALLAFVGHEIKRESIAELVSAIGSKPEEKMLEIVDKVGIENDLIPLHCIYYLVVMGIEVSNSNIMKVAQALGSAPSAESIERAKTAYSRGTKLDL